MTALASYARAVSVRAFCVISGRVFRIISKGIEGIEGMVLLQRGKKALTTVSAKLGKWNETIPSIPSIPFEIILNMHSRLR
jgi:hypothetical protein